MPKCTQCHEIKLTNDFSVRKNEGESVGLYAYCRKCGQKMFSRWIAANRKEFNACTGI